MVIWPLSQKKNYHRVLIFITTNIPRIDFPVIWSLDFLISTCKVWSMHIYVVFLKMTWVAARRNLAAPRFCSIVSQRLHWMNSGHMTCRSLHLTFCHKLIQPDQWFNHAQTTVSHSFVIHIHVWTEFLPLKSSLLKYK